MRRSKPHCHAHGTSIPIKLAQQIQRVRQEAAISAKESSQPTPRLTEERLRISYQSRMHRELWRCRRWQSGRSGRRGRRTSRIANVRSKQKKGSKRPYAGSRLHNAQSVAYSSISVRVAHDSIDAARATPSHPRHHHTRAVIRIVPRIETI